MKYEIELYADGGWYKSTGELFDTEEEAANAADSFLGDCGPVPGAPIEMWRTVLIKTENKVSGVVLDMLSATGEL